MTTRLRRRTALAALTLLSAGCVGVVPVKNVESDKLGYLTKTFTLQSVSGGVAADIKARDAGTLPFQKIVLSVTPQFEVVPGGGTPPTFHSSWTLINVGGPYVQMLDEQTSNGVETRQDYGISYRNLLTLRGQTVQVNRTDSSMVMEVRGLQSFTPLAVAGPAAGGIDIRYQWGNPIQLANLATLGIRCGYGARYAASRLNPKLLGEAQELNCEYTNNNGIVQDRAVRALLTYYGVTVLVRKQTATATVNFKIDDATIS
jgi:hypothetical protein